MKNFTNSLDEIYPILKKHFLQNDFKGYFLYIDSHHKQEVFSLLKGRIPQDQYWSILRDTIKIEGVNNSNIKKILKSKKLSQTERDKLMTKSELTKLSKLPSIVTVYRGENEDKDAWAWSLNKTVAATRAKLSVYQGRLLSGNCKKDSIIALFNSSQNHELIIPNDEVKNIEVLKVFDYAKKKNNEFYYSLLFRTLMEKALDIPPTKVILTRRLLEEYPQKKSK